MTLKGTFMRTISLIFIMTFLSACTTQADFLAKVANKRVFADRSFVEKVGSFSSDGLIYTIAGNKKWTFVEVLTDSEAIYESQGDLNHFNVTASEYSQKDENNILVSVGYISY